MRKSFAASIFAALLLALGGGAALAGNGHGNDGHDNGSYGSHSDAAQPQPSQPQQQSQPSSQGSHWSDAGKKPSSTTSHAGHDTNARADSKDTKLYGNGKTAGQIAMSHGAPGDTNLHGPGNSQPHKVTSCGHRHEVDVHAVKSYSATCEQPEQHVAAVSHEQKQETCARTVTVTVPAGVWHDSGSHWVRSGSKHAGDRVVSESTTQTITISDACKRSEGEVQAAAFQQAVPKCGHAVESVVAVQKEQPHQVAAAVAPAVKAPEKVYICHATGSATNPYVLIHVSKHAEWAHTHHQGGRDIVLGDTPGNGCPAPAPAAVAAVQAETTTCTCSTTTTTTPAAAAVQATTTSTTTVTTEVAAVQTVTVVPPTQTVTVTTPAATTTVAASSVETSTPTTTTTPAQGGVLGAQATIAPKKPSSGGGVLGAATRVAGDTLPFTGIQLWLVAVVAAALAAAGLTLRRAGR